MKYIIIQSCGDDNPKYKGVCPPIVADTIGAVHEVMGAFAREYSEYIDYELKIGDRLDEDMNRIDNGWAEHYWSEDGFTMWIRASSPCWEKVEVFYYDECHRRFNKL